MNIIVPLLKDAQIKKEADLFRGQYWGDNIPVDIEKIIEILKIDIVPISGFSALGADALISSDWQSIYVDSGKYMDEKRQKRLRFSFAHEIGHYILHKNIYVRFGICTIKDFYRVVAQIPEKQYGYLEVQANKFASHLLIPREQLNSYKEKLLKEKSDLAGIDFRNIDWETMSGYLANPISDIFDVSQEAAEIALKSI